MKKRSAKCLSLPKYPFGSLDRGLSWSLSNFKLFLKLQLSPCLKFSIDHIHIYIYIFNSKGSLNALRPT